MNIENALILILLGALFGLFAVRIYKNRKMYDVIVLIVLILGMITKLPIGENIPQTLILTVALGLAVVAVLSFLKSKSKALKEAESSSDIHNDNSNENKEAN